ncbi:MAG: ABC-three component system middle component 6 [Candidatus Aminicenantales bacterium]
MILPTKRIPQDRALLTIGGQILRLLDEPKTISHVWIDIKKLRDAEPGFKPIYFDWFVLSVDLLYIVCGVELQEGKLKRKSR